MVTAFYQSKIHSVQHYASSVQKMEDSSIQEKSLQEILVRLSQKSALTLNRIFDTTLQKYKFVETQHLRPKPKY